MLKNLPCRYDSSVGFNPFRQRVAHRGDIVIVVAAFIGVIALLVWAFLG